MRSALLTLIIASLLGIAVFGLFGMDHANGGGCIASTVQGALCPHSNNPLNSTVFHIEILKKFLVGVIPSVIMLLFALAYVAFLLSGKLNSALGFNFLHFSNLSETVEFASNNKFQEWLALREHSPSPS